ncbi:MAG: SRPBCC domain-containing protein [Schlesneria sp.]
MPQVNNPDAVVRTERTLPATPRDVFVAFEQPDRLAQWWGPSGFRNTFQQFEFKSGGIWNFVMHGPNGINYPNESIFREVTPDTKIVIEHVLQPRFTLTLTFTDRGDKTDLTWVQEFESAEVAERMRSICEPANEQNLDRLEAILASQRP